MTHSAPARSVARPTRSPAFSSSSAPSEPRRARAEASRTAPPIGLTIYGCGPDEAVLFQQMAPRIGVVPTLVEAPLSEVNLTLSSGNRCISVGHKTTIARSLLVGLSRVGVEYVSTRSIGTNHIDVGYAASVGIAVGTVAYSPDSVADYTLMLMLMMVRDAKSTLRRTQAHDYRLSDGRGRELRDMTVGVIGTGRIGTAVLERLRGFGCPVLAHDACPRASADHVPLDELLRRSDLVTLHTPLTSDTHHLLGGAQLDQMKPGALIVNTGRGALLDTEAVVAGLESGRLGGAALDVLEGEEGVFYCDHRDRPIENELLVRLQRLPNVLITPHTAYYTDHALRDTVEQTLVNCRRFARGHHG